MSPSSLELLAPAGSLESFFAALEAGADAVYCGLKEFSARARARNFELAEVERLSACAHREGKKLYVACNTLLKDDELERLLEVLAGLAAARIDGLIIQDLGVWRLARTFFPELALHASTQMAIHNAAGVETLESMGFRRAVLARELTLAEIGLLRRRTSLELEHFVHGALCYSISGHCLFSAFFHGGSGNRGRCAQPCRRRYHHQGKPGFHLSTADLCAINYLPQLIEAGVMSFKIEGRMKNPEYVSQVVSAYRLVLDAKPGERKAALEQAQQILAFSFGRRHTTGFLTNSRPQDIVDPEERGGIGTLCGVVEAVSGPRIFFLSREMIHVGDRLRVQGGDDQGSHSFTVREMTVGKKTVKRASANSRVQVLTPFRGSFQPGDQLFKIATGKFFSLSEEACRRRLGLCPPAAVPVHLHVELEDRRLLLSGTAEGASLKACYEVEPIPAERSPLSLETLQRFFGRSGHQLLSEVEIDAGHLPPVVIPPGRLKEIRRDFFTRLAGQLQAERSDRKADQLAKARASLRQPERTTPQAAKLTVVGRDPDDLAVLENHAIHRLLLPLTRENVEAAEKFSFNERLGWELPAMVYGDDTGLRQIIGRLRGRGHRLFRLNNLAHFCFFSEPGACLLGGPWLYCMNSQATAALHQLGLEEITLPLEDDRHNMARVLATADCGVAVTIYGPLPLFTSRLPLASLPEETALEDDRGQRLHLARAQGLTVGHADRDLSLIGRLDELRIMGCMSHVIDLSHLGSGSSRGRSVLAAQAADQAIAGTTTFNFDKG